MTTKAPYARFLPLVTSVVALSCNAVGGGSPFINGDDASTRAGDENQLDEGKISLGNGEGSSLGDTSIVGEQSETDGTASQELIFEKIDDGQIDKTEIIELEQLFWEPPDFIGDGCNGEPGYLGEAVQQALWFFNLNKSGPGITHTYAQWRGDSHLEDAHIQLIADDPNGVNMSAAYIEQWRDVLDPDANGELDMAGGFYDAGDFLKIGITSNFFAHTLGWTIWEFPEAFENTGLMPEALHLLRWHAEFALKNTFVENKDEQDPWKWNVVAYGHQVGAASDHDCGWMPPELRRIRFCPRQGFFSTHENPSADVTAGAAAALALTGWHFRLKDPEFATECLNHAIALYEFAKKYPGTTWSVGGLYEAEGSYDDLAWAAIWLHEVLPEAEQPRASELTSLYASHKQGYLDDLVTEGDAWLEKFRGTGPQIDCIHQGGSCWTEGWTHVWNSLRSGVFVKLAKILSRTGNAHSVLFEGVKNIARDDSLGWLTGPHSEGGFAKKVDVSWGSGRYNSAGQLVALSFARTFPDDIVPEAGPYDTLGISGKNTADLLTAWAQKQSEYLLGDNPLGQSYMMGFGDDFAAYAHHAATHASIYGVCDEPDESKHVAYGALVSGPNNGDAHSDDRCDYGANEITIDYNAAFLGALAGNYAMSGSTQCPSPDFPPAEPPFVEFYTQSRINLEAACSTQVEITLVNETAHPPRFDETLKVRYYLDGSELQDQGIDPLTMHADVTYNNYGEEPVVASKVTPCTLNTSTFYVEFSYPYEFWGEQVRLKGPRTLLLDIGFADTGDPSCPWDTSNDWSPSSLTQTVAKSPSVPAYAQGELVWGAEPECDTPPTVVVPPIRDIR